MPCILESISNLCLPTKSEALRQVVEEVSILLGVADMQQLPVIVRFLLENVDTYNVEEILRNLCQKLQEFLVVTASGTFLSLAS